MTLTTAHVGTVADLDSAFFGLLRQRSAILASGATIIDAETTEARIPQLDGAIPLAEPTPEGDPLPDTTPPLVTATVVPYQLGGFGQMSRSAWRDRRPATLAAIERAMTASIGEGFDAAVFDGAPAVGQTALRDVAGIGAVDAGGTLADLDPFAEAIGELLQGDARPSAIYMHPAMWTAVAKLKTEDGSNEPLIGAAAAERMPMSILGVPVFPSRRCGDDEAYVVEAAALAVVRRAAVEVDIDEHLDFTTGTVGLRAIARLALVVAAPEAVAVIENLPAASSS